MPVNDISCPASGKQLLKTHAEMQPVEHEFILQILSQKKPAKMLTVGVASGGTDALILKNTDAGQHVFGVDLSPGWYRDPSKKTGWEVDELCDDKEKSRYHLILGVDPVECISQIGGGIDFCLMDTVHILPGELLQFIAIFPYLAPDAILVLHDISNSLNPYGKPSDYQIKAYATRLLFCALQSATRLVPDIPLPNIGALIVDSQAARHINNVFFALGITWAYYPYRLAPLYRSFIQSHYNAFALRMFDECIKCQKFAVES